MNTDSVAARLKQFSDSWRENDGSKLGSYFAEAGTLVNPFGQRADGRAAIASMYSHYFTGMLKGTRITVEVVSVRALTEDYAFADALQVISGANGEPVLQVHLAVVLRREGDQWMLLDARPYVYASPGN